MEYGKVISIYIIVGSLRRKDSLISCDQLFYAAHGPNYGINAILKMHFRNFLCSEDNRRLNYRTLKLNGKLAKIFFVISAKRVFSSCVLKRTKCGHLKNAN